MLNRVTDLFIGKDIARSAGVVDGEAFVAFADGADALADGEIVVLTKNLDVFTTATDDFSTTEAIYIAQGTPNTFDVGSLTGVREVRLSQKIDGTQVKAFTAHSYAAKAEQDNTVDWTGATVTAGTEYIVRIIYKDIIEHPGQFTHTYRVIAATGETVATLADKFVAKINAHSGRRVNATDDTTGIGLTGRPIAECTTSVNDIDPFSMVEFDVVSVYVDSDGNWQEFEGSTGHSVDTVASPGTGTWEQLRDLEKSVLSHKGVTNTIHFPVKKPDFDTVKDETYDLLVITHDQQYLSPDNQYVKKQPSTTVIAIPVPAAANQMTNVLEDLNAWMATIPLFAGITYVARTV